MNKALVLTTISFIILLIVGVTSYKVINNHNEKVLLVESKYIIEKAKECINQKKCNEDIITLKKLYDLGIIDPVVNNVTKEYYNENSYIQKKGSNYEFIIVT